MEIVSNQERELVVADKLTSSVFGASNRPNDWADISLLIPHEAIRREVTKACASADQLLAISADGKLQTWQAMLFCEWVVDWLLPAIRDHHDNEEAVYFPWIETRSVYDNKERLASDHESLTHQMQEIDLTCKAIIDSRVATTKLQELQVQLSAFRQSTYVHFQEEERTLPPLIRTHFSKQEEEAAVQRIATRSGLVGLRILLPSIIVACRQWTTPDFEAQLKRSIPSPVRYFTYQYALPDYLAYDTIKRDAPFLEKEPESLGKVPCCKVFCFPCLC